MATKLVCADGFAPYAKGDFVTDPDEIAAIEANTNVMRHFRRAAHQPEPVAAPKPAGPVPAVLTSSDPT